MTDPDRRAASRHPATAVPARLRGNQALSLLDLGLGGARLETSEWLAPGRACDLRLTGADLAIRALVTRCAVVRVEDDHLGGRAVYEAAVRFDALDAGSRSRLDAVVAELGDRAGGAAHPRLAASSRATPGPPALVPARS